MISTTSAAKKMARRVRSFAVGVTGCGRDYQVISTRPLAWRPRPIPHAKWRLSGKGLVSAGKGHVLVHDFMDNE